MDIILIIDQQQDLDFQITQDQEISFSLTETFVSGDYVPYTGANKDVDLGIHKIKSQTGEFDNIYTKTETDQIIAPIQDKLDQIQEAGDGTKFLADDFTYKTVSGGKTTVDVVSDYTVGSVNTGDTIPAGTDIQALVNQVFLGTFYPTFTAPTFSLTSNQANGQEIGSTVNLTLTYNFNRGSINGLRVGGIWQPATFQDYRAGASTNYTIDGTVLGAVNTKTIASYPLLATQTFSGTVTYAQGPQPVDSDGANYSTPLAGGNDTKSTTITARYPYFWGKVTGGPKPTKNQALINSGTKVVADSSGTITVNFASSSSDWLWFAIPATSTSKTTWYETALNNGPIGGASNLFDSETITSIDSPTALWNGVNYKIYVSNYQSSATSLQLRN